MVNVGVQTDRSISDGRRHTLALSPCFPLLTRQLSWSGDRNENPTVDLEGTYCIRYATDGLPCALSKAYCDDISCWNFLSPLIFQLFLVILLLMLAAGFLVLLWAPMLCRVDPGS